ncbi:peptidase S13 D-Ala-D-Ala carboxypeptidase C [Fibrisoma limi BUZ 3]|uniref:Peptidase S13 D-Ala-D-Ala carboxypeptidase C n=1 Tax=Fibrisoma limi BUZ 3 TaxID=1185876 RepID=I2GS01_9BACT|nr:D-alanyl-D-alanine carboxypeptidase [Fibrisoma limi]CCH56679.1 peptidase S13 D-Ala-D-Ala carboxypeptidase C [Fibrisoma limi BUZ 3]
MRVVLLLLTVLLLITGCSPVYRINRDLRTKPTYTDHFTGVALYDPASKKTLIQHNADKAFTPASNTKLFSFYAGLLLLPDTLPTLRYVVRQDSLIFWGAANPLFLHPEMTDTAALAFLRGRPERLFYSPSNYTGKRFGAGWAWDDYNDDYSAELAPLPLYGNVVRFIGPPAGRRVVPTLFADSVNTVTKEGGIRRDEFVNRFNRPTAQRSGQQDVPFRWSPALAARLLADTLHRPVGLVNRPVPADARLLRSGSADSLYKRMLQVSDNQFAEHVLLMASAERQRDQLSSASVLRYMADSVLRYPATSAKWVDGSGLSRYNLFTPNVLIDLLGRIYEKVPQQRLFALLPAAGQSGTLRGMLTTQKPYVFAKSGSMSGVYNLSGYLLTRRGKLLFFSIMHNNFTQPVADMRRRTAELLQQLHDRL